MSESEDEPFDCVDCEWSGHNPEHISWDDRVLHHGERQNHYGGGVTSPGHVYGTYYVGSSGSYNKCPARGARSSLQAEENTRERLRKRGFVGRWYLWVFHDRISLEGML